MTDFPCDSRTNTPEFNEGYVGIEWDTPHDGEGNITKPKNKKGEEYCFIDEADLSKEEKEKAFKKATRKT